MVITNKHLQDLLEEALGRHYIAKYLCKDIYYRWLIVFYDERPEFIVKFHKESKYFCEMISLSSGGVNPIHSIYVSRASERLDEELDEIKSK